MDKDFQILEKIVQAANTRHKILSSNIANSDTPGYKAKDIKFRNLLNNKIKLLTTNAKHMSGESSGRVVRNFIVEKNLSWGDRNNVELNVEVAKMTENSLLHDAAVKILNTKMKMYKNAISGRGR